MKDIKLELSLDEINTIIEALGKQPFVNVYRLIEKLHLEAKKQIDEK